MIVQTISISCASIVFVLESLVLISVEIIYRTRVLIKNTAISVWSWKCKSSSMIGDAASWNPN